MMVLRQTSIKLVRVCVLFVSALSGPSLPSSSNSSAGPSSPTSASTPVDFLNKVKLYIIDSAKSESTDHENQDSEQNFYMASQNPSHAFAQPARICSQTHPDGVQQAGNQSGKVGNQSSVTKQTGSACVSPNTNQQAVDAGNQSIVTKQAVSQTAASATGSHSSAFKVVSRPGSQKLSFHVSQVSEESLRNSISPEKSEKSPENCVKHSEA